MFSEVCAIELEHLCSSIRQLTRRQLFIDRNSGSLFKCGTRNDDANEKVDYMRLITQRTTSDFETFQP